MRSRTSYRGYHRRRRRAPRLRASSRPRRPTAPQHCALGLGQQVVAPVDRRPQRLLTPERRPAPPVNNRNRSSRRVAICSIDSTLTRAAASSMASGMPSSRRQLVDRGGGVVGRDARSRATTDWPAQRRVGPPVDREGGGGPARGSRSWTVTRALATRLAGDPEGLAAGRQDRQAWRGAKQCFGEFRRHAAITCSQLSSRKLVRRWRS